MQKPVCDKIRVFDDIASNMTKKPLGMLERTVTASAKLDININISVFSAFKTSGRSKQKTTANSEKRNAIFEFRDIIYPFSLPLEKVETFLCTQIYVEHDRSWVFSTRKSSELCNSVPTFFVIFNVRVMTL